MVLDVDSWSVGTWGLAGPAVAAEAPMPEHAPARSGSARRLARARNRLRPTDVFTRPGTAERGVADMVRSAYEPPGRAQTVPACLGRACQPGQRGCASLPSPGGLACPPVK